MSQLAVLRRVYVLVPIIGVVALASTWGRTLPPVVAVGVVALHVALVLVAVANAEAIAHRVGEPYGTLVLALCVTIIEVALLVTLMATEGPKAESLARDTVFAAIMIVCTGVVGLSILVRAGRGHIAVFNPQGANALLGTVVTIATLSLVLPAFTSSSPGGTFTTSQLLFAATAALVVYGVFVFVQTVRHRWMFLTADALADESDDTYAHVAPRPAPAKRGDGLALRTTMLLVSLVGVVGLAKTLAPRIEDATSWAGAPQSFVGVVIALMILLPESIAAVRAAARGEMQTSLNLSLGSALASIGLTIPAIAVASLTLDYPVVLGLGGTEIVLLALTVVVSALTFSSGRATILQGAQLLAIFAAFMFLSVVP